MKKYWLLIIFCCASNIFKASARNIHFNETSNSDPIKKIAKEIAKANVYEYPGTVSVGGTASEQNIRYEKLLKAADTDELINLAAKNKNAVVRLYAYQAIVHKLKDIPKDLLEQFNNDTSSVITLRGTTSGKTSVNKIAESFLY